VGSAEDRVDRGEAPEDAASAARREFGNVGLVREVTRDMWGFGWLERLVADVRYACRGLRHHRVHPLAAIGTLALGMGAGLAFEVIDSLLATLPIDRSRIYITGFSMGGAGTWHMIAQRPTIFAAAVPVCGRGHAELAPKMKDVPIWNFHGARDTVEPVTSSRVMIEALVKAGGSPRHTEYPDLEHTAFAWAYTEPALVEWLFAQKR